MLEELHAGAVLYFVGIVSHTASRFCGNICSHHALLSSRCVLTRGLIYYTVGSIYVRAHLGCLFY